MYTLYSLLFTSQLTYNTAKCDSTPSSLKLSIRKKKMKSPFVAFLLIFALLLSNSFIEPTMGLGRSLDCTRKCKGRCAKAGFQDRCLKYCNICCAECKCVPSGTYGNKHQCPCYRDKRNSKGKPKCP